MSDIFLHEKDKLDSLKYHGYDIASNILTDQTTKSAGTYRRKEFISLGFPENNTSQMQK